MKLLLIVAVKAFQKEIQQLLKKANISSYSYKEVTGYQNSSEELIEEILNIKMTLTMQILLMSINLFRQRNVLDQATKTSQV